eukprot:m.127667 g.127667  ORF g.127667 m.127667 type:complete len:71 (+) comp15806_c0_seq6:338-550(+)
MQAYRVRLDTSTNWAVTTTSVLTVLAIGNEDVPHYFFAYIVQDYCLQAQGQLLHCTVLTLGAHQSSLLRD